MKPPQQEFYTHPLYTPPTPRRVFSGVVRDGETTIKIKISLFEGGGLEGQRGKSSKTLFFIGNATTIKF